MIESAPSLALLQSKRVCSSRPEGQEDSGIEGVRVSAHTFRHTYRTWLDSVGTPVGVQQKLMRHADIRTTMNIYGDAVTDDMRQASEKVARIAIQKPLN